MKQLFFSYAIVNVFLTEQFDLQRLDVAAADQVIYVKRDLQGLTRLIDILLYANDTFHIVGLEPEHSTNPALHMFDQP